MIIIVTGTPGTGKTKFAKKLAEQKSYGYIDVTKEIRKHKLFERYDKKRKSYVVDTKKLNHYLIKLIKENKREENRD